MVNEQIMKKVKKTVLAASTTFRDDKKVAYKAAIKKETNLQAKWVMEMIMANAGVAEKNLGALCDDTGIPHLLLDVGETQAVSGAMLEAIREGIKQGLRALPGRPMAIKGDDEQRISQSGELDEDPAGLEAAPILIRTCKEEVIRLHILMFGGGPAIRAKTYRVYHKHNTQNVIDEVVNWATEGIKLLGCSPCTLAIGIGRSHYEATSMMLQALVDSNYYHQSELETEITGRVNASNIGALGLHGKTSVLATFMKVGPQRASGVRIICVRPCCCYEPRIASINL